MKITFLLFFLSTLHLFAEDLYSQTERLSLDFDNVSIENLLDEIENQTEFYFVLNHKLVDVKRKISIEATNKPISDILGSVFADANVDYLVLDRQIMLSPKEYIAETKSKLQQRTVSGSVTDGQGEPLVGVTIAVKGTSIGTITDDEGNYTLAGVPDGATLVYSYVGMQTQEIPVEDQTQIDVVLAADLIGLEEVVAIGYGVARKSDVTGSVVSMGSEAVERQAATNITEIMRSSLPGLNVGTSTSAKGSSSLEIRGPTSLGTSNAPLIVVDDVIYQGDIAYINPVDIESVDILKDASAAAIYGAKAAAGVVIITTKKGMESKPVITFNSSAGFAHVGKMESVYEGYDYLTYRRDVLDRFDVASPLGYYSDPSNLPSGVTVDEWLEYDNLGGTTTPPEDIWLGRLQLTQVEVENYKAGRTVDWEDIVFQTGLRNNHNLSLAGGTKTLKYYTSLGYVDNNGIQLHQRYQSFRARINLDAEVTSFLSAGMNVYGTEERIPQGIPGNIFSAYQWGSPYSSLYYDDGTYRHNPHDDAMVSNPYLYEYEDNYHRKREVAATLYGKITLPFGFSFKVNWANRFFGVKDYRFTPSIATLGEGGATGSRTDITHHDWMVDNIFNWNRSFAIHDFDLTVLYSVEKITHWYSYQSNSEFDPNESLSYHNLAIGSSPVISNNDSQSTGDAFMARLNYGLLDRYLLTLSFRRDGYSAFGQDEPRADFPAAAVGWRISEEDFFDVSWLNYLKLRYSWGDNGNREIGQYSALSRMNTTKYIYGSSSVTGIYTTNLANRELKWERTRANNIGVDFATLKGRLSGFIEVYDMVTTDLLLERSLPNITGFESVFANLGEVQNRGLEITLNSVNFTKNNFTWNSNLNFWTNRNKINHLYGDMIDVLDDEGNVIGQREEDDIQNGWYIGHAIDQIFDYEIIGVWQLDEDEEANSYGRAPGDLKLKDVDEDGDLDFDDKVFQGYKKPRYRISFRNDFTLYKNFEISFMLIANLDYYGTNNRHFSSICCQERLNNIVSPYWTPDNPTTEWGRLFSVNSSPATNWWENKSFLRLQYLTIGYNLPKQFLNRISVRSLRIYGNVQNLPAISGWQYNWDVETSSPTPVIYTLGIDLSL